MQNLAKIDYMTELETNCATSFAPDRLSEPGAQICKRFRSPGIDFKIYSADLSSLAGWYDNPMSYQNRIPGNRFLGFFNVYKFGLTAALFLSYS